MNQGTKLQKLKVKLKYQAGLVMRSRRFTGTTHCTLVATNVTVQYNTVIEHQRILANVHLIEITLACSRGLFNPWQSFEETKK